MPEMTSGVFQPTVEWAQRKDLVYLTIDVEDAKDLQADLTDDKFHFRGRGGPDKREFECVVEFYKPADASKARRIPSDRNIHYVIPKKEAGPFWPRLLKADKKVHWVKVDFNKWKDEDDVSDEETKFDFNDMMGQMGGLGGGRPDLDDLEDSDNEDLPDLEDAKEDEENKDEEGKGDSAINHSEKKEEHEGAATASSS